MAHSALVADLLAEAAKLTAKTDVGAQDINEAARRLVRAITTTPVGVELADEEALLQALDVVPLIKTAADRSKALRELVQQAHDAFAGAVSAAAAPVAPCPPPGAVTASDDEQRKRVVQLKGLRMAEAAAAELAAGVLELQDKLRDAETQLKDTKDKLGATETERDKLGERLKDAEAELAWRRPGADTTDLDITLV